MVSEQSQNVRRNAAEKHGRAATYGPFKTMHTCGQPSARQHRSTRAAGIHDGISNPGGRWASHGGGGETNVDDPGPNFEFFCERTSNLLLEGIMLNYPQTTFALARRPGSKDPQRSGQLLWFACWLFTGHLCVWVVCCLRQF